MAVHASPSLLKQRVGKSRTYIRPIQQDLDLTPLDEPPIGVSQIVYYIKGFRYRPFYVFLQPFEKCLSCGGEYSLDDLSQHVEECQKML